jgi:MerR family transcriptional regulator, light-induced transcriptional regulator
MLGLPVATLRVWEYRYALCQPRLTPTGRRLYLANDVWRCAFGRQLTERGHAMSSLAGLDFARLQTVAHTHLNMAVQRQDRHDVGEMAETSSGVKDASLAPRRVAVIGAGWASRLQQLELLRALGRPWESSGAYPNLANAAKALKSQQLDALLVNESGLHDDWPARGHKHAAWRGLPLALLYGDAAEPVCEQLAAQGGALLREPQSNAVLAQWLRGWRQAAQSTGATPAPEKRCAAALPFAALGRSCFVGVCQFVVHRGL